MKRLFRRTFNQADGAPTQETQAENISEKSERCKTSSTANGKVRSTSLKLFITGGVLTLFAASAWYRWTQDFQERNEWSPVEWGLPWDPANNSWAVIASQRKAATSRHASTPAIFPENLSGLPVRLKYPVLWAAPFFTHSGYGTEAISYVAGLLQHNVVSRQDIWITQSGDYINDDVVNVMEPSLRQLLWDQEYRNVTRRLPPSERDRPVIVVCHVFPECWRMPSADIRRYNLKRVIDDLGDLVKYRILRWERPPETGCPCPNDFIKDRVVYRVGRSMFETERLPQGLAVYAHTLDEVLVPSQFNVESFSASGVPRTSLHVLPQAINTTLFDPDAHQPLSLGSLGGELVIGINQAGHSRGVKAAVAPSAGTHQADGAVHMDRSGDVEEHQEERLVGAEGSTRRGTANNTSNAANAGVGESIGGVWQSGLAVPKTRQVSRHHSRRWLASDARSAEHQTQNVSTPASTEVTGAHTADPGSEQDTTSRASPTPISPAASAPSPWSSSPSTPASMSAKANGEVGGITGGDGAGSESPRRPFRFLSVFKWEERKGWDVLLRAFLSEFVADEGVELHIVTHYPGSKPVVWRDLIRDAVRELLNVTSDAELDRMPRVFVHTNYIPESQYPGLYKAMDALVVPTHGEGWGRPQFEAMAMGLPVISTNWSGLTAFMHPNASYPVAVEGIVDIDDPGPDGFRWFKGQRWAQPCGRHLRTLMRHVVTNPADAAAKGAAARALITTQYSTKVVAHVLLNELLRIQAAVDALLGDALDTPAAGVAGTAEADDASGRGAAGGGKNVSAHADGNTRRCDGHTLQRGAHGVGCAGHNATRNSWRQLWEGWKW